MLLLIYMFGVAVSSYVDLYLVESKNAAWFIA